MRRRDDRETEGCICVDHPNSFHECELPMGPLPVEAKGVMGAYPIPDPAWTSPSSRACFTILPSSPFLQPEALLGRQGEDCASIALEELQDSINGPKPTNHMRGYRNGKQRGPDGGAACRVLGIY